MNHLLTKTAFEKINYFDDKQSLSSQDVARGAGVLSNSAPNRSDHAQQGVCILMSRGADYIAAVFAAWHAGLYVVPLNLNWPDKKNLDIIARINPVAVFVDDDCTLEIDSPTISKSTFFANTEATEVNAPQPKRLVPSDIAYIIFTSGSTGEPKGVVISVGSFKSYVDWTQDYFSSYSHLKRLLLTSELTFDITMGDIAFSLAFGTDIGVARQNTNIPSILAMIMRHEIDVLYSVPTTHLALTAFAMQKRGADISGIALILSGGDRFPWQLVKDYLSLSPSAHFYNVYGPTEVTINCFAVRLDDKLDLASQGKPVPIGHCFNTLDYLLLDSKGEISDTGELCVAGPQAMMGYFNDPELTKAAFVDDPRVPFAKRRLYRTGDLGHCDSGLMYLKGRIDGLIKIRGYRIHPDEVSKAIDAIHGVSANAVVSFGDTNDAALAAFIKLSQGASLTSEEILAHLKECLPKYMLPKEFVFVDTFPLNQSGKIDKNSLASLI